MRLPRAQEKPGELEIERSKRPVAEEALGISGMYMGELVRLVLVDMIDEGLMLVNQQTSKLRLPGTFPTKFLSDIEADAVVDFTRCRGVTFALGLAGVGEDDLSALRYICECVSRRADFMCAAGITALLKKMDYKESLFWHLHYYHRPHYRT